MSTESYLEELYRERDVLDPYTCQHSLRFLEEEIRHVSGYQRRSDTSAPHVKPPTFQEERVRMKEKVLLPVDDFPGFNFIGKLLGPKGSILAGIAKTTKCRISVLGRGSTKKRDSEEELSRSGDPQYEHLNEALHVLIEVEAPKSIAHERVAAAFTEIQNCFKPESDREVDFNSELDGQRGGYVTPDIRYGIPPPGAIILSEQPPSAWGKQRH